MTKDLKEELETEWSIYVLFPQTEFRQLFKWISLSRSRFLIYIGTAFTIRQYRVQKLHMICYVLNF